MRATPRPRSPRCRKLIDELKRSGLQCEVLFLVTSDEELLRRFAETRRKHPMSRDNLDLREAIAHGAPAARAHRQCGGPRHRHLAAWACTSCARSSTSASSSARRAGCRSRSSPSASSTAFPGDADFVFDARSLPNPYWEPTLRKLTGRDAEVVQFLEAQEDAGPADRRHRALHRGAHSRVRAQATAAISPSPSAAPAASIARCTSSNASPSASPQRFPQRDRAPQRPARREARSSPDAAATLMPDATRLHLRFLAAPHARRYTRAAPARRGDVSA